VPKVCILTTVHPPVDTRIFHKQAKTLVKAGYNVALIVQHDRNEVIDGIRIIALPRPRNRFARIFGLTWWAFWLALRQKADVYHFHDPELLPIGVLLRIFAKGKVIYDVHEDAPRQILSKYWIPKRWRNFVAWAVEKIENLAARFLTGIVAATPTIAERFLSKNRNTVVVQNFPILDEFKYDDACARKKDSKFRGRPKVVAYIGVIEVNRGIFEMVKAIEMVSFNQDVKLLLAGKFEPLRLKDEVEALPGWKNVEFLGWLDRQKVADVFSRSRAGLVLLHPEPRYMVGYPVKLFEYMSAGLPVIASNFPLWKEIIEGNNCGITVEPLRPQEIAAAIEYLLARPELCEEMGRNGRKAVEESYNWEVESKKLLEFYKRIL